MDEETVLRTSIRSSLYFEDCLLSSGKVSVRPIRPDYFWATPIVYSNSIADALSAAACIALFGVYLSAVLGGRLRGMAFSGGLAAPSAIL